MCVCVRGHTDLQAYTHNICLDPSRACWGPALQRILMMSRGAEKMGPMSEGGSPRNVAGPTELGLDEKRCRWRRLGQTRPRFWPTSELSQGRCGHTSGRPPGTSGSTGSGDTQSCAPRVSLDIAMGLALQGLLTFVRYVGIWVLYIYPDTTDGHTRNSPEDTGTQIHGTMPRR